MPKMACFSMHPETGSEVIGKKGKYLLRENIGSGGNGTVFAADVIEDRGLPQPRRLASIQLGYSPFICRPYSISSVLDSLTFAAYRTRFAANDIAYMTSQLGDVELSSRLQESRAYWWLL